jgi:hypothetical protein
MLMVYLHATFHKPSFSDSIVITIKLKLKKISACLHEQEFHYLMICYHTSSQGTEVSGASVACIMQIHSSAMLMLIVGN